MGVRPYGRGNLPGPYPILGTSSKGSPSPTTMLNSRLENIRKHVRHSTGSGLQAELRYLLDRVLKRDRIISSLTPEQWQSVASRVPPGHLKERDALSRIALLARELQKEAGEEAVTEEPAAVD